jgi:hypothetical protein
MCAHNLVFVQSPPCKGGDYCASKSGLGWCAAPVENIILFTFAQGRR